MPDSLKPEEHLDPDGGAKLREDIRKANADPSRRRAHGVHIGPLPEGEPARIESDDIQDQYGVSPFPSDAIPEPLQRIIAHYACKRGLPNHIVTAMVLTVVGASVRHRLAARSIDSDQCRPNLHVFFAAPSGVGKSLLIDDLTFPIEKVHRERLATFKKHLYADLKVQLVNAEKSIRAFESAKGKCPVTENDYKQALTDRESVKLQMRCSSCIHGNATEEGLFSEMALDYGWAFSKTDEASGQLSILMGQYSGTVGAELYVQSYNSKVPVKRTRKGKEGSGPPEEIIPIMAILWCTQPDQIPRLGGNARLMDGGFVPRLISLRYTGALGTFAERNGAFDLKMEDLLYEMVASLESLYLDPSLPPDQMEKTILLEREEGVEDFWKEESDRIKVDGQLHASRAMPFLLRIVEQGIKIAIILHLVKHALAYGLPHLHPITLDTARRGLRIAEWYARSSADLYLRTEATGEFKKARRLVKLLRQSENRSLPIAHITHHSALLAGDVQGIVDTWQDHNVFSITKVKTGKPGKPAKIVSLLVDDPTLLKLELVFPGSAFQTRPKSR